jgi:hypothetical protein
MRDVPLVTHDSFSNYRLHRPAPAMGAIDLILGE